MATESFSVTTSLLSLPTEVLMGIFSYLSSRDKLSLRCTCRRLRAVTTDQTMWGRVTWNYYGPRDDKQLQLCLKLSNSQLQKLELLVVAGQFAPSKIMPSLRCSLSLKSLAIYGYELSRDQLSVMGLRQVIDLRVQVSFRSGVTEHYMGGLIASARYLRSFVMSTVVPEGRLTTPYVVALLQQLLQVWSRHKYIPADLGVQLIHNGQERNILQFKYFCSQLDLRLPLPEHAAKLSVYGAPTAFCTLPECATLVLQCDPSKLLHVPSTQADCFGLSRGQLVLGTSQSSSSYSSASFDGFSGPIEQPSVVAAASVLPFLTHLCLDGCLSLTPECLELVADCCQRLVRVSLSGCSASLKHLQGMAALSLKCVHLRELNLKQIHRSDVESICSLWEVLDQMVLTGLAISACMLRPDTSTGTTPLPRRISSIPAVSLEATAKVQSSLKKLDTLKAAELDASSDSCRSCYTFSQPEVLLLGNLVSLQYLRLAGFPPTLLDLRELLENLKQLKYFYISKHSPGILVMPNIPSSYSNLEQLYIYNLQFSVKPSHINTLTSSGSKLTHIYLYVRSIDAKCVLELIQCLPELVVLQVHMSIRSHRRDAWALKEAAKSHGIVNFNVCFDIREGGFYPRAEHTNLLPIFN